MKVINISKRRLRNLPRIEISKTTYNTEGELYHLELKDKWETIHYAYKKLYEDFGEKFSNKLYTINSLIDSKEEIGMDELVMPESLVSVDGQVNGFIMPYIEHANFNDILNNRSIPREDKIDYFKQIGEILEKLKKVRKYTNVKGIFLNDLHEGNFIVDKDNRIRVVDMDSCKIASNLPFPSLYLSPCNYIYYVSKYKPLKSNPSGGTYRINENTDLYCYTVMILNFLYGSRITDIPMAEYYDYLEYLYELGVDPNLIDIFNNLYDTSPNKNPLVYLEELKKIDSRTHGLVFKKIKGR